MSADEQAGRTGLLAELLHPEARFADRVIRVLRFDASVYAEVEDDPSAIPQAFAVVIGTSVLVGLGQASLTGLLLGIAWSIAVWLLAAGLVWSVGAMVIREPREYSRLLRGLGFAFAWFSLQIGYGLPWIGWIFGWASVLLAFAATALATRQSLGVRTELAAAICAVALGAPLLLLWLLF